MSIATQRRRTFPMLWGRALALAIILFVSVGLVGAVQADADPTPFPVNPSYSAELSARIATYNAAAQALAARRANFKAWAADYTRRYADHERRAAQFPNGVAPPELAIPFNAEAAAGNAEKVRLQAEEAAINAESARLEAERADIGTAARLALNPASPGNQTQRMPPAPQQPVRQPESCDGGNPVHPSKPSTPPPQPPEIRPATVTFKDPVTLKDQELPGVPPGAVGRLSDKGKGWIYPIAPNQLGIDKRVKYIRVMSPKTTPQGHEYPNGYVNYLNDHQPLNQVVNPHTGKTIGPSDDYAHIPLPKQ